MSSTVIYILVFIAGGVVGTCGGLASCSLREHEYHAEAFSKGYEMGFKDCLRLCKRHMAKPPCYIIERTEENT